MYDVQLLSSNMFALMFIVVLNNNLKLICCVTNQQTKMFFYRQYEITTVQRETLNFITIKHGDKYYKLDYNILDKNITCVKILIM